jgi:hypothetical protein
MVSDELRELLDHAVCVWTRPTPMHAWSGDYIQIAAALRSEHARQVEAWRAGSYPPNSNLLSLAEDADLAARVARLNEAASSTPPRPSDQGC